MIGGLSYLDGTEVAEPLTPKQHTEVIIWSIVVGMVAFVVTVMGGLAGAPHQVLTSRTLLWLRSSSGGGTILALRVLLGAIGLALTVIILLRFTM